MPIRFAVPLSDVVKMVMTHFVEVGRIMEDAEYARYLKKEAITKHLCTEGIEK